MCYRGEPSLVTIGRRGKVLTETLKKHCDSLSSKLNKKDGKSSKLNVRNIDKRMEWKKKKKIKKKTRKKNPACPTNGKSEIAWKFIKWMLNGK